jgi:hypothetical protein
LTKGENRIINIYGEQNGKQNPEKTDRQTEEGFENH